MRDLALYGFIIAFIALSAAAAEGWGALGLVVAGLAAGCLMVLATPKGDRSSEL